MPDTATQSPNPIEPTDTVQITSSSGGVQYQEPTALGTTTDQSVAPEISNDKGKNVNVLLTVLLLITILGMIGAVVWLLKPWEAGFSLSDTFGSIKEIF